MKILVILGGTLGTGDLAIAYAKIVPQLLQEGIDRKGTPFAKHEIYVEVAENSINAYFEQSPDKLILLGTFAEKGETPPFVLFYKMLARGMAKRDFLYSNPITVPPFNKEENFFPVTETDKMAEWLGL